MAMTDTYIPILGLPVSGKTTFLAALWHLLNAGEIESRLVLDKLVGNHDHLNRVVGAWRRCEEVPRTSIADQTYVKIHAHDRQTDRKLILDFPDLSGESLELQFSSRSCTEEYLADFAKATGMIVFVNADRSTDPLSIVELQELVGPADDPNGQAKDWSANLVPEQARLVDLLQFLQEPPFERRRRKMVIAISAWDVVQGNRMPGQWLEQEMPLLNQFLKNNQQSFETVAFGVSAQGGNAKSERDKLLAQVPSERLRCVGPGIDSNDISLPIAWLSGD
jgi:hypothetical protein